MKLCIDCALHQQYRRGGTHWCQRIKSFSPVDGKDHSEPTICDTERKSGGSCGPEGAFWTPIVVKQAEAA